MKLVKAYKYCPLCKGDFKQKSNRLFVCQKCNHKQYINPVPCNGVIIVNDNNQIMLVKRKVAPKKEYWDLPGGFIEPGESFETSVKREITEELGIDIEIKKIVGIYNDIYFYENLEYPTMGIVVSAKLKSSNIKVADDISSFKFFEKKDVLKQKLAFKALRHSLEDYINNKLQYK
jgi:NAD+ diphosphatase